MWTALKFHFPAPGWARVFPSITVTLLCCFSSCHTMTFFKQIRILQSHLPAAETSSPAGRQEAFGVSLKLWWGKKNNKESGIYILPVYLILRPPSVCLGDMLWFCGFQPNAELHGSHPTCALHARARLHTSACCVYVQTGRGELKKNARGRACSTIQMSKCIGLSLV